MAQDAPQSRGILQTLRRLGSAGAAMVHNRVELFAVELQEEKARLIKLLLLTAVGVLLANMTLLVVTATIVALAGEAARTAVLIGLCLFYALASTVVFLVLWRNVRGAPPPFEETVTELKKDCEWLKPQK